MRAHVRRWQHVYAAAAFLICVPAASAVIVIALQYFAPVVVCK